MPSQKASKNLAGKKPGSYPAAKKRVTKKSGTKKSTKKRSSPGVISKAKKAMREVVIAAVAGAAKGAVTGAAEAGSKATGIGQPNGTRMKRRKANGDSISN